MQFDPDDMEVIILSTEPPELSPSEQAHVEVLRARCRWLRQRRTCRGVKRRPGIRVVLAVALWLALFALLL